MCSNSCITPLAHIRMHTSYDLCGDGMTANENFVVLIGNWDSASYQVGIIIPSYPVGDQGASGRVASIRWEFCRANMCIKCDSSPEAATLHPDCLQLFMRSCAPRDALERLWFAATWHDTLPRIRRLRFPKSSASFFSTFAIAAEKCNLPQIKMLPREIRDLIQELSEPHLLCRYVVVLGIALQLSYGPSEPLVSVPMNQISSWERGSSLKPVSEATAPSSIIRCVIDFLGLKKIERLTERPLFERGRHDDMSFIVEKEDAFSETIVQFKSGLGRLEVRGSDRNLHLWDTPTPPDIEPERYLLRPEHTAATRTQFATIDLDATMGFTFLIGEMERKILAVHCHTERAPSAQLTADRFSEYFQRKMIWVYFPLPRADKLIALGNVAVGSPPENWDAGNNRALVLRTLLAGDVIIARIWPHDDMTFRLMKGTPATLAYAVQYPYPISFILPYYEGNFAEETTFTSYSLPELEPWSYSHWPSSYAKLENIRRVQVFLDRQGIYCRGLLFSYENGGQRVLGQCRLHVDRYQTFIKPMSFCIRRIKLESGADRTIVRFGDDLMHSHGEDDSWICFSMAGTLGFYFRASGETLLSVYQKNPIIAIE